MKYKKYTNSKHLFGLIAEYFAIITYILSFHSILAHRYRVKVGEIDFIAKRGYKLIFVEVKGRNKGIHYGIVKHKQQERIRRAAELFLMKNNQYYNYEIRFDLVVIRKFGIPLIIKNAF